jgi:hypothetical protein
MDEKFIKDHIFVVSVPKYDWEKIAKEREERENKKEV